MITVHAVYTVNRWMSYRPVQSVHEIRSLLVDGPPPCTHCIVILFHASSRSHEIVDLDSILMQIHWMSNWQKNQSMILFIKSFKNLNLHDMHSLQTFYHKNVILSRKSCWQIFNLLLTILNSVILELNNFFFCFKELWVTLLIQCSDGWHGDLLRFHFELPHSPFQRTFFQVNLG